LSNQVAQSAVFALQILMENSSRQEVLEEVTSIFLSLFEKCDMFDFVGMCCSSALETILRLNPNPLLLIKCLLNINLLKVKGASHEFLEPESSGLNAQDFPIRLIFFHRLFAIYAVVFDANEELWLITGQERIRLPNALLGNNSKESILTLIQGYQSSENVWYFINEKKRK